MSGPFGSSQWMYSSGAAFYPTEIGQSLRFNDDDQAYLSRTPASAGNRKTFTFSAWVKICDLATTHHRLLDTPSSNYGRLFVTADDNGGNTIRVLFGNGTSNCDLVTSAKYRDTSAWYHIVVAIDTPQATPSNRAKLYVNGELVTDLNRSTYMNQDVVTGINSTTQHVIGGAGGQFFDGYLAEVNFIDGQALDPTDFGEFKSGVWVAKSYAGSYGTNGFYLNFSDSANIGDDLSGNANDWTANNLVATDVVLDSPTNNFNVLNAISPTNSVLSNGNLQQGGTASLYNINSTFSMTSGKWYAEFCVVSTDTAYPEFGILPNSANFFANATMYQLGRGFAISSATVYVDGSSVGTYTGIAVAGTIVGIAYDADTREVRYSVNGVWQNSGNAVATLSTTYEPDGYSFAASGYTSAVSVSNFGQDSSFAGNKTAQGNTDENGQGDFYYTPLSGYLAVCAANLPDPAIDPAQDDIPADYFGTSLWTGNSSTQSITGLGFQPDLIWAKGRSLAEDHALVDIVRSYNELFTNLTSAENTTVTGFDSVTTDGFDLNYTAGGNRDKWNANGFTYVGWSWLAGNGTSSNSDGSISSTISVNQKAGFSIVSYTGTGANATVGHGLGVAPSMVIVKQRNTLQSWVVWQEAISGTDYLLLNSTAAKATAAPIWNSTIPTSTVFNIGTDVGTNQSGGTYIAYCFAEVEGYSKFGSYTGNGSNDGPFIYCGFRPSLFLTKRTDSTSDWQLLDTSRDTYNAADAYLKPNTSGAEATGGPHDFVSNGFKIRNTGGSQNASGGTYIYMAFAENPFKYANAR